jgi:hypothetical protein
MKTNKLKAKLVEQGKVYKDCTAEIGLSMQSFSNKVNGKVPFTCVEAEHLGNYLGMTDEEKVDIFLK